MIGCWLARRRLLAHITEGNARNGWLAGHIRECPGCAREVRRLEQEVALLRGAVVHSPLPDANALWARIEANLPRRRSFPALAPAGVLVAACLGSVVVWALKPTRHTPPQFVHVATSQKVLETQTRLASPVAQGFVAESEPLTPRPDTRAQRPMISTKGGHWSRRERRSPTLVRRARQPSSVVSRLRTTTGPTPFAPAPLASAPLNPAPIQEEPMAAVVVVHSASAQENRDHSCSYLATDTEDPFSGEQTHLMVSRQTDESGALRQVTIVYEVQPLAVRGVGSET